jgi:hypothetical protein
MLKSNMFFVDERVFNFGTLVPSKNPEGSRSSTTTKSHAM